MPGPGGGHSGGGFGGGSAGGGGHHSGGGNGFGGGSFGGGGHQGGGFGRPHGPHHHGPHHHGPMWHRPFRGGWGWGWGGPVHVGGGCFSVILIVIFVALFAVYFFLPSSEPQYVEVSSGVEYNEATMQNYANEQYKKVFGDSTAYEDNILLVFLTNEEADGYYTIAWVGDNIKSEINEMFGEYSEYGEYLSQYINTNYYAYTLDSDLADVISAMTTSIVSEKSGSSFNAEESHDTVTNSHIVNYTDFDITQDVVNKALEDFTKQTDIPCVIVVESAEKVFGADTTNSVTIIDAGNSSSSVGTSVSFRALILAVGIIAVVVAVFLTIKKKNGGNNKGNGAANKPNNDMPWES